MTGFSLVTGARLLDAAEAIEDGGPRPMAVAQDNWRWCSHSSGLYFAGHGPGRCPVQPVIGVHSWNGSANYGMYDETYYTNGQPGWRWCHRCQGIFFTGNGSNGHCPAGNALSPAHDPSGSGNYAIGIIGAPTGRPGTQAGWRWCSKCQGLFYGLNRLPDGTPWLGVCPAGGAHSNAGSGNYILMPQPTVHPVIAKYLLTWQSFPDLQDTCDSVEVRAVREQAWLTSSGRRGTVGKGAQRLEEMNANAS